MAGLTTVRFDLGWRWSEPERKGAYDAATLAKLDAVFAAIDLPDLRLPGIAIKLGEHTDEVLAEVGYGAAEVEGLRAKGVV